MKSSPHAERSGAVMIFAVMLMTAGVFVLAAVLQLAATQGVSGEEEWNNVERRVTLLNSRSMAREHLLTRLFRVPQDTNNWPVTFSNASGGFSVAPNEAPETNYWEALNITSSGGVNVNPFNLLERGGFYREVFIGQLAAGDRDSPWKFTLRTRSPITAKYCFVQHRPDVGNDLASLAAPPYIDMNGTAEQFYGFYGLPRMPICSVVGVMTRGAGDANGYQGFLDVPFGAYGNKVPFADDQLEVRSALVDTNVVPPRTNVTEYGVRLNLGGTNTISATNSVCYYTVPATTNLPGLNSAAVTKVVLVGTNNPLTLPLHVIADETSNVDSLDLDGAENERPVYFYRAKLANTGSAFVVSSTNASDWRLALTISQSDIIFDIGSLEIRGGLRTDGMIDFQGGSANFVPDAPTGLDFIADRMMWLEDNRLEL